MTETQAYAYTGAPGTSGADIVDWVVDTVALAQHWMMSQMSTGKALIEHVTSGAQIVLHGTATQIQVGYAPDGGVTTWDTTPTAAVFSGMRNITGSTAILAGLSGQVRLVEYDDALTLILAGPTPRWVFGFSAGVLMSPFDRNDPAKGLTGDALMTGRPDESGTAGGWLVGAAGNANTSVFRAGANWLALAAQNRLPLGTPANVAQLERIGSVERLVPYIVAPPVAAAQGGQVGVTRYMRQWRRALPHEVRLSSDDVTSEQAWITGVTDTAATPRNNYILWAKTETTV